MSERRFNPNNMSKLDSPERLKLIPPDKILAELHIKENDDILDLGAGTGYFTLPAARMTNGTMYALDVEPKMLNFLQERLDSQKIKNVEMIQGPIENIPMEDLKVDCAIASMVLHEVEPLSTGLQEIYRVLKQDGRCICVEWEKKQSEQGPPLSHRIHSDEMKMAIDKEGFKNVIVSFPSDQVYVVSFEK